MKKDLSWWDYDKHYIIKTTMQLGYLADDTKNVAWKIWHHDKTAKKFFSNLDEIQISKDKLTRDGNGYYEIAAVDGWGKGDILILFRYKDYELISVSYSQTKNHMIYKEYLRK